MLKVLPKKSKTSEENNAENQSEFSPKNETLFALLNYSKSVQGLKVRENKVLMNLN